MLAMGSSVYHRCAPGIPAHQYSWSRAWRGCTALGRGWETRGGMSRCLGWRCSSLQWGDTLMPMVEILQCPGWGCPDPSVRKLQSSVWGHSSPQCDDAVVPGVGTPQSTVG